MNKITTFVLALSMVFALSQCKKSNQPISGAGEESVMISLYVTNNSRVDVNTSDGTVTWDRDDVIHVASNGKYVGTLSYNGSTFSGTITNPTVGMPLHFYFLGNVSPEEQLVSGITTSCTVDICDQSTHLPVISYAPSQENYPTPSSSYTACLQNKCALVKFNVTTSSDEDIYITGLNHTVTINFEDASFEYGKVNSGNINIGQGSGEKWAILLPQEALEEGQIGSVYSNDNYLGYHAAIPAIGESLFLTSGINVFVNVEPSVSSAPTGAINGKFSINSDGDLVYFSQGNLQYIGSAATPYWKFADYQWEFFGNNGQGSASQAVDRDLFGWGTSGYDHGAYCYQPWSVYLDNLHYYAYGDYTKDLFDEDGSADWGYNPITNGGNQENQWRTLAQPEWYYVINSRNTSSGIRFVKAELNGQKGLVLFPDDWKQSYYPSLANVNSINASYDSNVFTAFTWIALEANGAVFLPAVGERANTTIYTDYIGRYWTASRSNYYAIRMAFSNSSTSFNSSYRGYGSSVRLVQDCSAK